MCAIDNCEPWRVYRSEHRTARKPWSCCDCARRIPPGERYNFLTGMTDDGPPWQTFRWCVHCAAVGEWLNVVCCGYPLGALRDELREHWDEGYRSVAFGRLIVAQCHGWHDGRAPVPDRAEVAELARSMMAAQVAA